MVSRFCVFPLVLLIASPAAAQEAGFDPCEPLLAASSDRPVWPGIVVEVASGDTLIVQLKDVGRRRIRLAGLRSPRDGEPLASVSRFHLSRMAKGLRIFVVVDLQGKPWPDEVVAVVEDFAEAQLAAAMGRYLPEEEPLLGSYVACRCRRAEEQARQGRTGIWAP